ncbi:MAG: nucleotidyltransferase family protein [Bacteroidales bacterium]|nr:nucleotidyltransferase family protein [Bacteroidales bacterium]
MDLESKISNIKIGLTDSILFALKKMDKSDKRLLLVFEGNHFKSLLSIGDIQRAIIKGVDLGNPISEIIRQDIKVAKEDDAYESIKNMMLKYRTECMPVLNKNNNLINVYFWEDVFEGKTKRKNINLDFPVVIMAGGKGTRLKPITNVLPKGLIPLGEKTILEEIMDKFTEVGCNHFYLSVNYRAEMIKHYFDNLNNTNYNIKYFQEEKPLGTAGSMYLLKEKIKSTFFVSNCDILIEQDLDEIFNYHRENNNNITIVSAIKYYQIPYGTIETCENGVLSSLQEKPELTFQINTGMYIMEPEVINEIPDNTFLHITDLIEKLKDKGAKVGVFPVSEGAWKDIGEWSEYSKYIGR